MTQFAAGITPPTAAANPRAAYVDDLIRLNRAINPVPQQYLQRREQDRLTVREINELDDQAIAQGIKSASIHDTRTATERFLDVLDLPRNAIANIAFGEPDAPTVAGGIGSAASWGALFGATTGSFLGPAGTLAGAGGGALIAGGGTALAYGAASLFRPLLLSESDRRRIVSRARQGTFGSPQVYTSDLLERLGMENNVARAVVGFGGDILLDPTTYLSGGGNVITKIGTKGEKVVLNKGGANLMRQVAKHVSDTGTLPIDPVLSRFNHLFQTTVQVGDELIPVADNELAAVRSAIETGVRKLSTPGLSPEEIVGVQADLSGARRRLAPALDRAVVDLIHTDPTIGPAERFRGGIARDFARDFAARSSHQAMIPFSSVIANRLPGFRSGNLPLAGLGEPGMLHRFLKGNETEFLAAREAAYTQHIAGLRAASQELVDGRWLVAPERSAEGLDDVARAAAVVDDGGNMRVPLGSVHPDKVAAMVSGGWKLDRADVQVHHWAAVQRELDRVDHIRRSTRKIELTEKVRSLKMREQAAAEAFDEARYQADVGAALAPDSEIQRTQNELHAIGSERIRAELSLGETAEPPKLDIEHSLDSQTASMREGDAAMAMVGPYAMFRRGNERLFKRSGPTRYRDLEMRAARIRDANAFGAKLLDIERQRLAQRLAARGRFAGEKVVEAKERELFGVRNAARWMSQGFEELRSHEASLPTTVAPRPVLNLPKGTPKAKAKVIRAEHRARVQEWKANNNTTLTAMFPVEPLPEFIHAADRPVVPATVNERRVMAGLDESQRPPLRAAAAAWAVLSGQPADEFFTRLEGLGGVVAARMADSMTRAAAAPTFDGFMREALPSIVGFFGDGKRTRMLTIAGAIGVPIGSMDRIHAGIASKVADMAASGVIPKTKNAGVDANLRSILAAGGEAWRSMKTEPSQAEGFRKLFGDPASLVGGMVPEVSARMAAAERFASVEGRVVRHRTRIPATPERESLADASAVRAPAGVEIPGRVSNKGRSTSFDLSFTNDIDRAIYEAGRNVDPKDTEAMARQRAAIAYVSRTLGVSEQRAAARGRMMIRDIEEGIFGFSPTIHDARKVAAPANDRRVWLHDGRLVSKAELVADGIDPKEAKLLPDLLEPTDYRTVTPAGAKEQRVVVEDGKPVGLTLAQGTLGTAAGHMPGGRHFVVPTSDVARRRLEAGAGLDFDYKASQPGTMLPWDMTAASREKLSYVDRIASSIGDQARAMAHDVEETGKLAGTLADAEIASKEYAAAAKASLAPLEEEIRAIEAGRPFMWIKALNETMRSARTSFNLNTENHLRSLTRRYGFESKEGAAIAKAKTMNRLNGMVAQGVKETGADPAKYRHALTLRIFEKAVEQDERGVVGLLADDVHQNFISRIAADEYAKLKENAQFEAVADSIWRTHNDWAQIEAGLGILGDDIPRIAYVPIGFTEGAKSSHIDQMRRLGEGPAGRGGRLAVNPQFSIKRASNRMLWGPENEDLILRLALRPTDQPLSPAIRTLMGKATIDRAHWIWSGELNAHKATDEGWAFERWRRDFLRRTAESGHDLMTPGDRHLLGLPGGDPSAPLWMPQEFPTSPAMLNYMRDDFRKSGGAILAEEMFEEDILTNFSRRLGQHLEARASERFMSEVAPFVKLKTREEVAAMPRGATGGTVVIDGLEYRPVKRDLVSKMRVKFPVADHVVDHYYWPVALADDVEDMARKLSSDADLTGLFRAVEKVQGMWKAGQLLFSPSWWTGNMLTGAMMSWLIGGSRPSRWPSLTPLSMSIVNDVRKGGSRIDSKVFTLGGVPYTGKDLKELFVLGGVVSAGRNMIEIPNIIRTGGDSSTLFGKLMAGSKLGAAYGWWFGVNAATDDLWRVVTAVDLLEQGHSVEHAIDTARKAHVDFSDFSHAEQKWGTLVWPFYRWVKGNMSLQIRHFLDNPSYGAAFPKLRHALDEGIQAEDELPLELQPQWLRDNIAVQIGSNPTLRFALLKTLTPAQELFEAGSATMGGDGFFQFLQYVMSSTNPLLKMLPEIAGQKEFFSGRPLGDVPGGIPWADYLLNQIGPWGRGARAYDRFERGVTDWPAEIARQALGGTRVHSTSPQQVARQFEFTAHETSDSYRSRIRAARRRGDTDEAARLAGELVDHNRRLYQLGYINMVPMAMRSRFRDEMRRREAVDPDR